MKDTKEKIIDSLREVYDPEIPINVYDLGLIYKIEVKKDHTYILMTLTSPACPTAEYLQDQIREAAERVVGEGNVKLELTFEPKWSPERVSKEAKEELGFGEDHIPKLEDIEMEAAFHTHPVKIEKVCFNCSVTDKQRPIIECYYKGEKTNICSVCLSKFK